MRDAFFGQAALNNTDLVTCGPSGQFIKHEKLISQYAPNVTKMFSTEVTQKLQALETDITKFVNESKTKWLMNVGIEKEWDDYKSSKYSYVEE